MCYVYLVCSDFVKRSLPKFINGLDSELVYAIFVSPENKMVTVAFRGSVNANDWYTNTKCLGKMTDFKLPGYTSEETQRRGDSKSYGRVHEGFYEYLFGKTKKGDNGSNKSKAEEIIGILSVLFEKECKGFSLYVTGHSLGKCISLR
jgi:hypothetical protein